jgi:lipid A 3-O-deacylase
LGGVSNDFDAGHRLTTEYGIGAMGPMTGQGRIQRQYHSWLIRQGSKTAVVPQGWVHQLPNALILNVRTEYESILFSPVENIETIGGFEVNFGTLTNYIALNAQLRIGKFNDYFYNSSGLKVRHKTPTLEDLKPGRSFFPANINRRWQYYFYAKPSFRFALNNSLLQGGVLSFKPNPYALDSDELQRFYAHVEFGYGIVYNRVGLLLVQQFRTPEFQTAKPSTWGGVYLIFGLGGK